MLGRDACRGENKAGQGGGSYGLVFYMRWSGRASLRRWHLSINLREGREREVWLPGEEHPDGWRKCRDLEPVWLSGCERGEGAGGEVGVGKGIGLVLVT